MAAKDIIYPQDWTASECKEIASLAEYRDVAEKDDKKVILVTGVFDLLHQEHKIFLGKAAQLGDILIVGLESDVRVRKMKGSGRPVQSQTERLSALLKITDVSRAFILPEAFYLPEHHRSLIQILHPDILAVSSHSPHQEKKQQILNEFGGTLQIVHEHNPHVSTTKIVQSMQAM